LKTPEVSKTPVIPAPTGPGSTPKGLNPTPKGPTPNKAEFLNGNEASILQSLIMLTYLILLLF
jgi:hypothetical protein